MDAAVSHTDKQPTGADKSSPYYFGCFLMASRFVNQSIGGSAIINPDPLLKK